MKKRLTSYTFDASEKTVTHADFSDITLEGIQLIVNVTDQIIIYNFADTSKGGTLSTDTLTLEYDTTTMDDTDKLMILVDDGVAAQAISAASLPLPSGAATSAKQDTIIGHVDGIEGLASEIRDSVQILDNAIAGNEIQADVITLPVAFNTGTRSATTQRVTVATDDVVPVVGTVAHDGIDSGNPVKIGGKVSTSVPTAVAAADRVDAWLDEYGRQVINDSDIELGVTSGTTGLRDRLVAQRCTTLSDSLADGIAGFWTQTTAGGGGIASTGGEGRLTTSTGTTGSAQISSTNVAYYPGQVAWMNSAVRFGDTGTAGNIRRIGMFTVSGTTPQEGFYFELSGTTLNAVYVKAGTPTAVASGSWSRNGVAPFTLDTNYHSFEIRYTANTIWFYIDNVLRHQVSGTSSALTTSLTLPITVTNVKTSGASDITFAIRNIGNGRFGQNGGVVAETGLSAVEALAMGGGTPHDSVDSGNPLKIGGKARSTAPTAVAASDRVDGYFDLQGRQIVAAKSATSTLTSVAGNASSTSLLAANTARIGATLYNDSTSICYVRLEAAAASSSNFAVKMQPEAYYEVPFGYTGELRGIWASATGNMRVTELT